MYSGQRVQRSVVYRGYSWIIQRSQSTEDTIWLYRGHSLSIQRSQRTEVSEDGGDRGQRSLTGCTEVTEDRSHRGQRSQFEYTEVAEARGH